MIGQGKERVAAYMPRDLASDACRLGWIADWPGLDGTPHGEWSVMMLWLCECRPAWPVNEERVQR